MYLRLIMMQTEIYRESSLCVDWSARNLFARSGPLLPVKPPLRHLMLAGISIELLV
jgi:hypothetical protein